MLASWLFNANAPLRLVPPADPKEPLDPNATFAGYRASDVKKEFHQLLNTTNDPMAVSPEVTPPRMPAGLNAFAHH